MNFYTQKESNHKRTKFFLENVDLFFRKESPQWGQRIKSQRSQNISSIFVSRICQILLDILQRKYGIASKRKLFQYIGGQAILLIMFQKIVLSTIEISEIFLNWKNSFRAWQKMNTILILRVLNHFCRPKNLKNGLIRIG